MPSRFKLQLCAVHELDKKGSFFETNSRIVISEASQLSTSPLLHRKYLPRYKLLDNLAPRPLKEPSPLDRQELR
jgi:hypothetical protein